MDISVIVPFYNEKKYIEKCIRSLLFQEYPSDKYEIFMVDNNSTDGSADIVRKYRDIKLLVENKIGAYAARNRALEESKGEIIAFTDSDCVPQSNWLRNISKTLRNSDVRLIQGRVQFIHRSKYHSMLEAYETEKADYVYSNNKKEIYFGYTNNMAARKELFDSLGSFEEIKRGADVIFVHKVIETYSCDAIKYSDDVRVLHLEIDSLSKYYQKNYTYGKSSKNYGKFVPSRPLSTKERLEILRKIIKKEPYSMIDLFFLLLLLFTGSIFYGIGRLQGNYESASIKRYQTL